MKKKIKNASLSKRTIILSDIHGHLDLFIKLLNKINYAKDDTLIIIGDFIEKGPQILDTIHYLMDLSKRDNVYVLLGNCEWAIHHWTYHKQYIKQYLRGVEVSIFHEAFDKYHIDYTKYSNEQLMLFASYILRKELKFLETLPTLLDTDNYIFVHAGIESRDDYLNSSMSSMLEQQQFLQSGHKTNKYVVVGHYPTSNYRERLIDNSVIVDHDKKIIAIDGGVGVKRVVQLNACIIENQQVTEVSVDSYLEVDVYQPYDIKYNDYNKIGWPNYKISIIKEGNQFSKCLNYKGEIIYIKNEFIFLDNNQNYCIDDYCSRHLTVIPGDKVSLVGIYGEYAYVLKNGQIGWILKKCISKQ